MGSRGWAAGSPDSPPMLEGAPPNRCPDAEGTTAWCFSVAVKSSNASRIASRSSADALCSAESAVGTCLHMHTQRIWAMCLEEHCEASKPTIRGQKSGSTK